MEIYNNILKFEELSSTNAYAFELVKRESVEEFTTIFTQNQIDGKGQRGNVWLSEPGKNALFSVILFPIQISPIQQFIISQCVSISLLHVIEKYCSNVSIKWPNDIYVNDKKIAGILIENIIQGGVIKPCVIGIGLNCNQLLFDKSIPNPTSIKIETGKEVEVEIVIKSFLLELIELYKKMPYNFDFIRNAYKEKLYKNGLYSLYEDEKGEFLGRISDVDDDGKIHIVDKEGKLRKYFFKEVVYK